MSVKVAGGWRTEAIHVGRATSSVKAEGASEGAGAISPFWLGSGVRWDLALSPCLGSSAVFAFASICTIKVIMTVHPLSG